MNIEALLKEEIQSEFETLKNVDTGSEEYKATVDGLTKLVDRAIEIEKFNAEREENELKREQMKDEKIDRWVKNGLTLVGVLVPAGLTVWGTYKSFKFEETGTITTIMGRGFINKLLPKK